MTEILNFESILLLALAGLLIGAAVSDLTRFIIPNWLNVSVLVLGVIYQASFGDLLLALASGLIVFIIGFILFALRAFGGGDIKLLAATAIWAGLGGLPLFTMHTAIAGGLLALIWMMSGRMRQVIAYCGADIDVEVPREIPYGIAICAAGLLMVSRLLNSAAV